jgi:hypothetical protein
MKALIMAGGTDAKWPERGGTGRRHTQMLGPETVLERLVRQLRQRGVKDIGIICLPDIEGYDIPGTYRITPTYSEWGHEALNGREHWSDTDRTVQVYGDMIFAEPAMDLLVNYNARRWMMWGRFGNGVIKGGGGELFATSFWPEHRDAWEAAQKAVHDLKARGIIRRSGSWEAYRYMAGARGRRLMAHRHYPACFINIRDGLTDDFDTPQQFEKLRALHGLDSVR